MRFALLSGGGKLIKIRILLAFFLALGFASAVPTWATTSNTGVCDSALLPHPPLLSPSSIQGFEELNGLYRRMEQAPPSVSNAFFSGPANGRLVKLLTLYRDYLTKLQEFESNTDFWESAISGEEGAEMKELAETEKAEKHRELDLAVQSLTSMLLSLGANSTDTIEFEISAISERKAVDDLATELVERLFSMYQAHAANNGLKAEVVDKQFDGRSLKRVTIKISGTNAQAIMGIESGFHKLKKSELRVNAGARVTVMPYTELPSEIHIPPSDLDIKFSRSGGPGGQGVNKLETRAQVKHLPTGIMKVNQDTTDKNGNRDRAIEALKEHLLALEIERIQESQKAERDAQDEKFSFSQPTRIYDLNTRRILDTRFDVTLPMGVMKTGSLDLIMSLALRDRVERAVLDLVDLYQMEPQ